jgi:retron-type reverse transcriptase
MNESDYIKHRILKRDGSLRTIMEPKPELKRKQKSIMHYLQSRGIRASKYSHGFVSGRSTATHARLHVGRRVIVKVDIEDFFGSVTSTMIITALRKEKLQSEYINEMVEVCTLNAVLPQGAPSSPLLSNIVFKEADYRIAGLAKKFRATYSRYADDLCFSSNNYKLNLILPELEWILNSCEFKVNHKKTQVIRKGCRQIITGVVVNKKAGAPRELGRNARARIFSLKMDLLKKGYFDQEECDSLKGLAAYIRGISPESGAKLSRSLKELELLKETIT